MKKEEYIDPLYREVLEKVPKEIAYEVSYSFDIAKVLKDVLDKRKWSQVEFANKLGKKESEISKWLSGVHPFTLKTLAKISSVIDEDIIYLLAKHRKRHRSVI
ncbi:MAG: helix-turn-helix transcriptional regulator [Bacteroidales bacterium]|nr:helix-turn-helix transcriptional regulator [Bacteroidales bacterium]